MRPRHPPVILKCAICGIEKLVKWNKKVKTCSRKCGRALSEKTIDKVAFSAAISRGKTGKTHRGVPHSEETRKVLSEKAHLRMSDPDKNPFIGKKRSEESRAKQSATRAQRFVDGTYNWKTWARGEYVDTVKAGRVWCRSSWETSVVRSLDSDPDVVEFKTEPFSIPYMKVEGDRSNLRHYVPDFLVTFKDGRKVVAEIKPPCHVDAAVNVAKFVAGREFCAREGLVFEVWDRDRQRLV